MLACPNDHCICILHCGHGLRPNLSLVWQRTWLEMALQYTNSAAIWGFHDNHSH